MVFMIVFPSLTKIIKDTNEKIDSATVSIIEEATTAYLSEKSVLIHGYCNVPTHC